jgi:hypothetical protein
MVGFLGDPDGYRCGGGSAGWIVDIEILVKGWGFNSFELAFESIYTW